MSVSVQDLRQQYGDPANHAQQKVLGRLDEHCQRFIQASPFAVLASHDGEGHMDASPRGGAPGFIEIIDEHTLHLPDRPGTGRLDSLSNVCTQGDVGLLFFVPGINETLRVNGQARILVDESLSKRYSVGDHAALAVMEISVTEAFIHGGKAVVRSRLWDSDLQVDDDSFPTLGEILTDQVDGIDDDEMATLSRASGYQNLY